MGSSSLKGFKWGIQLQLAVITICILVCILTLEKMLLPGFNLAQYFSAKDLQGETFNSFIDFVSHCSILGPVSVHIGGNFFDCNSENDILT